MRYTKKTIGYRCGSLVVIGVADPYISPSGKMLKRLKCQCDCGNTTIVNVSNLSPHKTVSCGCVRRKILMSSVTDHGESKTRLYSCWNNMMHRCKYRSDCLCDEDWGDFRAFKSWALLNGYDDTKVLCRNGDVGDYTPSNCRWDTVSSNLEEAHAKRFMIVCPDGIIYDVYNLKKFAREHGLEYSSILRVAHGKYNAYKGWTRFNEGILNENAR